MEIAEKTRVLNLKELENVSGGSSKGTKTLYCRKCGKETKHGYSSGGTLGAGCYICKKCGTKH